MQKLLRLPAHSDGRCHIRVAFDRWNRNCLLKPTMDTRFASFWTDRLTFFCLFDRTTRVACGFSAGFAPAGKLIQTWFVSAVCLRRIYVALARARKQIASEWFSVPSMWVKRTSLRSSRDAGSRVRRFQPSFPFPAFFFSIYCVRFCCFYTHISVVSI